jgi:hypothetical protein
LIAENARFNCVTKDLICCLDVCLTDTVFEFAALLAERMQCLPAELLLICKGRILSRYPTATLAAFGLKRGGTYKLLAARHPARPVWLRITAHFLCCSLPPTPLRMHATSPIINIKRQLRELLRTPYLSLSLHLADGEELPDCASLQDLGVRDGARVYCRIHCDNPPPAEAVEAGRVLALIESADRAADEVDAGPRRRRFSQGKLLPSAMDGRLRSRGGGGGAAYLGMRRGFLSGRSARAAPSRSDPAAPADGAVEEAEEAFATAA